MKCCCGSICNVGNAVRLSHFILTFFVLYVMLTNQHSGMPATDSLAITTLCLSLPVLVRGQKGMKFNMNEWNSGWLLTVPSSFLDLHHAWKEKNAYFICLVTLLSVSLFLYLVASFIDPGFLPKSDPPLPSLKTPTKSQSSPSFPAKVCHHKN